MRGAFQLGAIIVVLIVLSVAVWLANYLVWFGADAPQVDYYTKIREMQAGASGASPDDYRAHGTLLELASIIESLKAEGLEEPFSIDHDKRLDEQTPEVIAGVKEWISACEQRSVFAKMDELAALPSYILPWEPTVLFIDLDYLEGSSAFRKGIRASGNRGRLALYAGDSRRAIEESERQVGLSGLLLSQPIALNRLVGHAVLAYSIGYCRELLQHGVSETELAKLTELYDLVELFPIEEVINGERLIAQNAITGTFHGNRTIKIMSRGAQWARIESEFDRMQSWSGQPAFERARSPFVDAEDDWRYVPADILLPAMSAMVRSHDQITTDLNGIRLEIAIERYRQETGSLPATLDDLLPDYIDELPGDIFAEGESAYRYRVLGTPDEQGRAYHLYSVGYDGVDNGGVEPEERAYEALAPDSEGTDFMLHRYE